MHRRPKLNEAIELLNTLANKYNNEDAIDALQDYHALRATNEFLAARMVVEIADHYHHLMSTKAVANA